ncbi:unnamed protein product [Auanema sp. JU1783]|nr:unnamed protein product [Auanema sp. JU1783]
MASSFGLLSYSMDSSQIIEPIPKKLRYDIECITSTKKTICTENKENSHCHRKVKVEAEDVNVISNVTSVILPHMPSSSISSDIKNNHMASSSSHTSSPRTSSERDFVEAHDESSDITVKSFTNWNPNGSLALRDQKNTSELTPGRSLIEYEGKFNSFAEFEEVFNKWKDAEFHPFRVASSETLKNPDGSINTTHKYRYVVYHCAHYGNPRMRGNGKRPNQTYLPCGCNAMLRLNYKFSERALRITTLITEHNHPQNEEYYNKSKKAAKAARPAPIKAKRRATLAPAQQQTVLHRPQPIQQLPQSIHLRHSESPSSSEQEIHSSSPSSVVSTAQSSPALPDLPRPIPLMLPNPGIAMPAALPNATTVMYQQQLLNVLLAQQNLLQQKENLQLLAQQLQVQQLQLPYATASSDLLVSPMTDMKKDMISVSSAQVSLSSDNDQKIFVTV